MSKNVKISKIEEVKYPVYYAIPEVQCCLSFRFISPSILNFVLFFFHLSLSFPFFIHFVFFQFFIVIKSFWIFQCYYLSNLKSGIVVQKVIEIFSPWVKLFVKFVDFLSAGFWSKFSQFFVLLLKVLHPFNSW